MHKQKQLLPETAMRQKSKYKLLLFYSPYSQESQRTRVSIRKFIANNDANHAIDLQEVDYDREKPLCRQYGVVGIPTLLIYENQSLRKRHLGEISYEDIKSLMFHSCFRTNI